MKNSKDWKKRKNMNVWRCDKWQIWKLEGQFHAMRGHVQIGVYCKGREARAACIDDKELYNAYFNEKN